MRSYTKAPYAKASYRRHYKPLIAYLRASDTVGTDLYGLIYLSGVELRDMSGLSKTTCYRLLNDIFPGQKCVKFVDCVRPICEYFGETVTKDKVMHDLGIDVPGDVIPSEEVAAYAAAEALRKLRSEPSKQVAPVVKKKAPTTRKRRAAYA